MKTIRLALAPLAAVGLVVALLSGGAATAVAQTSSRICTSDPEVSCPVTASQEVQLWKAGHYNHAGGMHWARITTHRAAIKSAFRVKFTRMYKNASAARKRALRQRYNIYYPSTTARDGEGGCSWSWTIAFCAGKNILESVNHVSCNSSYGAPNYDVDNCTTITGILGLHNGQGFSKEQIQDTGTVGYCAGNAWLAVQGAARSPEGPGPLFFAGWGASQCALSAWIAFGS